MHIILACLTAIVTILILINRLPQAGVHLRSLNPFLLNRRNKWRNRYEENPVFSIHDPMQMTAILMRAIVKVDEDMTPEDKSKLLDLFMKHFYLAQLQSAELLISSTYLLQDGETIRVNLKVFLKPSLESFTTEQRHSAVAFLSILRSMLISTLRTILMASIVIK